MIQFSASEQDERPRNCETIVAKKLSNKIYSMRRRHVNENKTCSTLEAYLCESFESVAICSFLKLFARN